MAKIGRPTDYTPEMGTALCEQIISGKSLRRICSSSKFPAKSTVFGWLARENAFADQYARAKEISAHVDADDIAWVTEQLERGKIGAQEARVIVDAKKWTAAKKLPKVYDVQRIALGGPEGGAVPLRLENLNDAQLTQFLRRIDAAIAQRVDGDQGSSEGGTGEPAAPEG